ncbi:MAG: CHASE domain-containing protein, partial [Marinobacter sp.]
MTTAAHRLDASDLQTFTRQADRFLRAFPEVSGLELLSAVSDDQRPMVERQLSEQADQFVRFTHWTGPFESQPAGEADQYLVIRQSVLQDNAGAGVASLGLVATSVRHWRDALEKALQENRATATTVTSLQRNGGEQRAARVFVPVTAGNGGKDDSRLIAVVLRPQVWLEQQLEGIHDPRWQVKVHDNSQYARQSLASLPASSPPSLTLPAMRSTVTLADRQWMISTRPGTDWIDHLEQQALWPAWLVGLTVTLLATGLSAWASWQMIHLRRLLLRRTRRTRRLGQQLDNTRVEKNILQHSLQESDRRARDLIELGAGIFAELDEGRHIGYLSPQTATLLNIPSTELVGMPLDALFPDEEKRELAMTFDAARRDQGIQRLDTAVVTREGETLPVALRVRALKDPLSGCAGFRVSLTPRQ